VVLVIDRMNSGADNPLRLGLNDSFFVTNRSKVAH